MIIGIKFFICKSLLLLNEVELSIIFVINQFHINGFVLFMKATLSMHIARIKPFALLLQ